MNPALAVCVSALLLAGASGHAVAGAQGTAEDGVQVERDVVWRRVDGELLGLDAYLPVTEAGGRPAVLLVHGGGWQQGDRSILEPQGKQLAELGYVAFSVSYRLAPEHPYPAAVDDVQAAVEWLRAPKRVKKYGIDPDRIGALGTSAGGHLVGLLATLGKGPLDEDARVRAAVSWSGAMDFTAFYDATQALTPEQQRRAEASNGPVPTFLGCSLADTACEPTASKASPITHVDRTDAPLLLVSSETELLPVEQAHLMDAALTDAGVAHELVIIPGSRHARALAPDVWDDTVAFLAEHLGTART